MARWPEVNPTHPRGLDRPARLEFLAALPQPRSQSTHQYLAEPSGYLQQASRVDHYDVVATRAASIHGDSHIAAVQPSYCDHLFD